MTGLNSAENPTSDSFALEWAELSALADKKAWDELAIELDKRLDEEEFKLQRNGIKPNFLGLGWRVLLFASYSIPEIPLQQRLPGAPAKINCHIVGSPKIARRG